MCPGALSSEERGLSTDVAGDGGGARARATRDPGGVVIASSPVSLGHADGHFIQLGI